MGKYRRTVARECMACSAPQPPVYGIPDPCLGTLPGVANACCGHGCEVIAYVHFEGDPKGERVLRGVPARDWQIANGGHPAEFSREPDYKEAHFETWIGWRAV